MIWNTACLCRIMSGKNDRLHASSPTANGRAGQVSDPETWPKDRQDDTVTTDELIQSLQRELIAKEEVIRILKRYCNTSLLYWYHRLLPLRSQIPLLPFLARALKQMLVRPARLRLTFTPYIVATNFF
jgi:hypothetical protein